MRAAAPGKLVLSGAYSVLEGAPAIVTAVDRYVVADTRRPAAFITEEVRAAGLETPPWFDASRLRDGDHKLGLGSSAAIVVASLGALEPELSANPMPTDPVVERLFQRARHAHRVAQGGGSGIDVAAASFGGTLAARLVESELQIQRLAWPPALHVQVWFAGSSVKTSEMLRLIRALPPQRYDQLMAPLCEAASSTLRGLEAGDADRVLRGLAAQRDGFGDLGDAAGAPILTEATRRLQHRAGNDFVIVPSGAGGGDVTLCVGYTPPSTQLEAFAIDLGHRCLHLELGAAGVHRRKTP